MNNVIDIKKMIRKKLIKEYKESQSALSVKQEIRQDRRNSLKSDLWYNSLANVLKKHSKGLLTDTEASKYIVFNGIKMMILDNGFNPRSFNSYQFISIILANMERLTYRDIVDIFPITKDYNPNADYKEYYYTKNYLYNKGINNFISEPMELLFEYQNEDLNQFLILAMLSIRSQYETMFNRSFTDRALIELGDTTPRLEIVKENKDDK